MKKTFLSALLLATALTTGGAKAETIFEALSTAYDTNPTLQAQRAYLRSVDENVAIAKSGPDQVVAGEQIAWTLTLSNAGPSVAHQVVVTDTLPAGVKVRTN